MSQPKPSLQSYLHLHFVVLIWGFTAIIGLLVSLTPLSLVFYRTLLASAGMGVLLFYRKIDIRLDNRSLFKIIGTGVLIAFHWFLFFGAARASTASVCLAGMSTCSLWTSLIEPLFNHKKISWLEVLVSLVVIIGLYVIFLFEFNHILGLVMALASALLAAVFSIINGNLTRQHNALVITFYEMIGAFLTTVIFLPLFHFVIAPDEKFNFIPQMGDWLLLFVLAWICSVYAYTASLKLLRLFSVFAMNLTINLEPVYGIILAFLILGEKERMTAGFYAGTLVILLAVLAYPWLHNRLSPKSV